MSLETGLNSDDIVSTLQFYSMLKYWKGKHIVLKRKVRENIYFFWPFCCTINQPMGGIGREGWMEERAVSRGGGRRREGKREGIGQERGRTATVKLLIKDTLSLNKGNNLRIMDKLWCPKCRLPYYIFNL